MVANQLRTVFSRRYPVIGGHAGGRVSPWVGTVFEVCVVASDYPDEGRSSSEGADSRPELPFRVPGANRALHTEARAELRDRETYYEELRLAVHSQSRSFPRPRTALEDSGTDRGSKTDGKEGWGDMTVRIDDTWT
jgi:hypothetical protein